MTCDSEYGEPLDGFPYINYAYGMEGTMPDVSGNVCTAGVIFSLFRGLQAQGKTVVMVTHDEDLAARCDRIIRLSDGRVIGEEC